MPSCKAGAVQLRAAGLSGGWMRPPEGSGPERAGASPEDEAATAFALPPWGNGAYGSAGTGGLHGRDRGARCSGARTNPRAA